MGADYKTRVTCRACGGHIGNVLDLGDIHLNAFVDEHDNVPKAPLTLAKCDLCDLVQLRDTPDLDLLYRQYWYQSGLNKSMVEALQDIVDNIEERVELEDDDVVIDIGCNDGTMLAQYSNPNLYKIGFDPAYNLAHKARKVCDEFHNTYFGDTSTCMSVNRKAKVITSIAMFYDLEDPHTFVELIRRNLDDNGIWVVQFTDLLSMMRINAFDTICHEHLEYYSLAVLNLMFAMHDLQIFDVSTNKVNGGSIRVYVCHENVRPVSQSVYDQLNKEYDYFDPFWVRGEDPFKAFANRVASIRRATMEFLEGVKRDDKTVFAMGASTKGNTLLQYFGITPDVVNFAAEVNKDKFGKYTVGTKIPIISEEEALRLSPDYFIVLPWHFIDMLLQVHKPYLASGGKFMVPMPIPAIYSMDSSGAIRKDLLVIPS